MYEGTMYDVRFLFKTKDEIDGTDKEEASHGMVPSQRRMERDSGEDDEDHEGNHLLNHFELHQSEGATVTFKAYPVGRNLEAVLEESDAPGQQDHKNERCRVADHLQRLQFEMSVPGERHEYIRCQ